MIELITVSDWLRMGLLYCHLILCAFALTLLLKTDIAIVFGKVDRVRLKRTAMSISNILLSLWITGLAIVYIDTGFSLDALLASPKLLFKMLCVSTLTINGVVLHHLSFPVLVNKLNTISKPQSALVAITGALSTSHWMLAAFVGMSKPLNRLSLKTLLVFYAKFVGGALASSLLFIPVIHRASRQRKILLRD